MSEPPPLPEGTVIAGKLRVVRLLGMGGMGSVYEVEHEFTKHRRALKMLHADMLQHPMVVARFVREASAAGHIGNPHIVETFDAGKLDGGEPYIVMEMLAGETLAARLERVRRLALPELVDVIRQSCEGVQAAHDVGIVHRDLKPDNLFLIERDGKTFVKILDFGVSKFDPTLTGADGTTKEGSALGTPYYMSPEQVDGDKDLDARTDVYALGVILYQCACGKRPFKADALPKLAVLIHEGKPMPLSERRPELPTGFVEVVHKAMARDRNLRFATPRELAAALEPYSAVALDATMLETSQARAGSTKPPPPPAIAQSGPPPPPEPTPDPKRPALTDGGSALSLAGPETAPRAAPPPKPRGGMLSVLALGGALLAAAVVVVVGRGSRGGAGGAGGTSPVVTQVVTAEPAAAPSLAPSSVELTPLPSATVAATPSAKPGAALAAAPTGSVKRGAVAPAPSATASGKPSSRAEQKGLAGENPF
ncbi:MAG: protein kinase [Polyangiaceae bacterium]|jgi:serine/threonine-protein kinase